MKKIIMTITLLLMVLSLSSCGGSGSGDNPTINPVNSLKITVTPVVNTLPANTLGWPNFLGSPFETQVDVRVTFANGQGVATGVIIHMQTSNTAVASVGIPDDPETDDVNEYTQTYVGANQETIGSTASYFIRSGNTTGTATFTISATHPTTGRNYEKTLSFTTSQGPDQSVVQLTAVPTRAKLPANTQNVDFFNGTPFMIEADIQVRNIFGSLTEPGLAGTTSGSAGRPVVKVSVTPSSLIYLTKNDDIATTDINEFLTEVNPTEIVISGGHGSLYIWSKNIPGVATITLSTVEAGSGFQLSHSFQIEVVGSDISLPTDIVSITDAGGLYVVGSGGDTTKNVQINVTSGSASVLDPQVNNVQLSLVTDGPNSGESISATNFNGATVQGTTIKIATVAGIANAVVHTGSSQNTIVLTATTDGLDNNVDNGIQQPISHNLNFVISDGVLWALELTSPSLDALTVNAENDDEGVIDFQDGTYSLVISAQATDKSGNPALPQMVRFGMINSPITGYPSNGSGSFVHSALDGDPQEGARGFTSASGQFLTSAGGVQPNDTLVVFGEESLGNEDLESAVTVANVNSQSSLTIVEMFNRNDETGTIDNNLGVLPYAIGRAVDGNITATAVINSNGVATTRLNYPVSQLGRIAAIFVTGQGATNGVTKVVTDVEVTAFPGVEGFNEQRSTLIVSPSRIPGNVGNIGFVVCLADSARNPLPGRAIGFNFVGSGSGVIDGQTNSGRLSQSTGSNGCVTGVVSTTGILPGSNNINTGFNFFSGGLTCDLTNAGQSTCMQVVAPQNAVLNATPSGFNGGGNVNITLTLYDGSGNPISGAALSGSCSAPGNGGSLSINSGPSVTNSNGQSSVTVSVSLDAPNGGLTGTCQFATASGSPSVIVNFSGSDSCSINNPSPTPPQGSCNEPTEFSVSGTITGITGNSVISLQNNAGNTLNLSGNTDFTFPLQNDNTSYNISVSSQPAGQTCTVNSGSGNISGSHVTNVLVSCN